MLVCQSPYLIQTDSVKTPSLKVVLVALSFMLTHLLTDG